MPDKPPVGFWGIRSRGSVEREQEAQAAQPVPAGWYPDPEQAATQRYWDGAAWTDQRAPTKPPRKGLSRGGKIAVVCGLLVLLVFLAYNTNVGKRALAYLGIEDCYELTLTGNVVCGDQADKLANTREDLREDVRDIREDSREEMQEFDREAEADQALIRKNIITERVSYSDSEGFTVVVNSRGIFKTQPAPVCDVMETNGYLPAQVRAVETSETVACQ